MSYYKIMSKCRLIYFPGGAYHGSIMWSSNSIEQFQSVLYSQSALMGPLHGARKYIDVLECEAGASA